MSTSDARTLFCLAAVDSPLLPYRWGGESPEEGGYDCSGRVSDRLAFAARFYPDLYDGARRTAAGLRSYYLDRGCIPIEKPSNLVPGCLTFHAMTGKAPHHVRIHLVTLPLFHGEHGLEEAVGPVACEYGGAGSDATTFRKALMRGAGFQLVASDRPNGEWWGAIDPFAVLKS